MVRLKIENFFVIEILFVFVEDWGVIYRYIFFLIFLVVFEDRIYEMNFIVWNIDIFFLLVVYMSFIFSRMFDVILKNVILNGEDVFVSEFRKFSL